MQKMNMAPSKFSVRILLGFVLIIIMAAAGCASWDDRNPRPPKLSLPEFSNGSLLQKAALALFDNRTGLRFEEVEQSFLLPLNNHVKDGCSDMVLYTPFDPGFPEALIGATLAPEKGVLDNMAIARIGRALGLGFIITGRLGDISGFEREKGFWLFKSNRHYARIMGQVDLYAAETGAKILSDAYSREIEISESEFQALANSTLGASPEMMEAFQELAEDIADDICDILNDTYWIGFVTGVSGDTVTLSSGADVGLEPGAKLELYNSDKIFQNSNGGRFFVPGTKTGEIEITTVNPKSARATLLPDSKAGPGYAVRLR